MGNTLYTICGCECEDKSKTPKIGVKRVSSKEEIDKDVVLTVPKITCTYTDENTVVLFDPRTALLDDKELKKLKMLGIKIVNPRDKKKKKIVMVRQQRQNKQVGRGGVHLRKVHRAGIHSSSQAISPDDNSSARSGDTHGAGFYKSHSGLQQTAHVLPLVHQHRQTDVSSPDVMPFEESAAPDRSGSAESEPQSAYSNPSLRTRADVHYLNPNLQPRGYQSIPRNRSPRELRNIPSSSARTRGRSKSQDLELIEQARRRNS